MATFTKVGERKDKRRSGTTATQRWYERTWYVEADAVIGGDAAKTAFGVPQMFTSYATSNEQDMAARVIDKKAKQITKSDKSWAVVVRYETRSGSAEDGKWEQNPLLRPPKMSNPFEEAMVPVVGTLKDIAVTPDSTDIYEEPMLNAAGQPFVPQPEVEDGNPVLVIVRNEETYDPAFATEYNNSVNNDTFMGFLPRQLKVRIEMPGGQSEMVDDEEVVYYPVHYTFKAKREGWDLRVANRGTEYKTTGGDLETFATTGDNPHVYEDWLTANGQPSTGPNYIKKRHYREKPYADFNLPNQFI
jgi:hypothetical protein